LLTAEKQHVFKPMNFSNEQAFYRWRPAACLQVSGEDALTFLQGQVTNDLHQDAKGGAVYGLWLNQKGKVLADSFVRKISNREAWIVSYFSPAMVIRERLEAYIIADDVVIADATETMMGITVFGAVTAADFGLGASGWSFSGRRTRDPHTEIIFPVSAGTGLSAQLADGILLAAEQMEWKRIAAGIPAVPTDIGPADLPNEGGLEAEAISYTKGCYLGQEVMARLKSMGQVRRRLIRVRGAGEPPPRATALYQGERKVGELRSTARDGAEWIGLALVALPQLRRDAGLALAPGGAPAIGFADEP
jgi:folate-binding protein YgfZ